MPTSEQQQQQATGQTEKTAVANKNKQYTAGRRLWTDSQQHQGTRCMWTSEQQQQKAIGQTEKTVVAIKSKQYTAGNGCGPTANSTKGHSGCGRANNSSSSKQQDRRRRQW